MKTLFTILLATICAASGYGQTIRTLGYNSTNGQIVAATNVVWTNAFSFSTNTVSAQVRTNLGLGASDVVSFNQVTATVSLHSPYVEATTQFFVSDGAVIEFEDTGSIIFNAAAAPTRTNLFGHGGISTNIAVLVSGGGTNTLVFTNGILKEVQ